MKSVIFLIICVLLLNSCENKSKEKTKKLDTKEEVIEYKSFGKEIISNDAIASSSMAYHYKTMNIGDSIHSKIKGKVNNVCQAKGCWMTLNLEDGNEIMVKFKDYGFFVPKDIIGKEVIVNGKAYVKEISVDEQRHYAEDAEQSTEDIARIVELKKTYSFEADGVLVQQ